MSTVVDVGTDDGLRQALRVVREVATWDVPAGQQLLTELRRKAVRHASRIGRATGERCDRDLVDDVVCAAWTVLDQYAGHVIDGDRPWAYLMSTASRRVCGEIRASRQLTSPAGSERAATGGYAPRFVARVGCSATDVATAFGHEHPNDRSGGDRRRLVRRAGSRVLDDHATTSCGAPPAKRDGWYDAFLRVLVAHGADETATVAAVEHLSNLFTHTQRKSWETAARRDPVLARLGLSADQCGALVALLAGSRRERASGQPDSLLSAIRHAEQARVPVELSVAQRRRLAVYLGRPAVGVRDTGVQGTVAAV